MRSAPLLALMLCAPSPVASDTSCGGPKARQQMADILYSEREEFRDWVCDEECTMDEFRKRIEYHDSVLRERPSAIGCFVEQVSKATNSATGVFVVSQSRPALQFVFHGTGIGPKLDGERVNGYRVLVGSEHATPTTFARYYYVWNGKSYVLRSKAVEKAAEAAP